MKLRGKKNGLFLVSAILVSFAIALFVGAALRLSVGNLKANQKGRRQATMAADSGLQYVQSRISEDPLWRADGGLVIDTPELVVHEQRGNILGIIRVPEGGYAQFRIRFNYQDDSTDDEDDYQDPTADFFIDNSYVSVNNLFGGSAMGVPRATSSNWSVESASPRSYSVPGHSLCVIAEGRYGPGLSLSPSELNPDLAGSCATRVIEAYLEPGEFNDDKSGSMSAGNTTFKLDPGGQAHLSAKDQNIASRIRSRDEIKVLGGDSINLTSEKGETYTPDGRITASQDGSVDTETELNSKDFYKLEWDQIRKATNSDPTIAAGTYTVWDDGSIHYYDMSYPEFAAFTVNNPTDAGATATLPSSVSFDPGESKLTIGDNLFVQATTNTSEFNFIPRAGAQEDPPGAVADLPLEEKVERLLAGLGEPRLEDEGGGSIIAGGGAYRDAIWTIPLEPGTRIEIEEHERRFLVNWFMHGIYLEEVSPGMGELKIDDGNFAVGTQNNMFFGDEFVGFDPPIDDGEGNKDPFGALEYALTNSGVFGNQGLLDDILTKSVVGSTLQEFNFTAGPGSSVAPTLRADKLTVEFAPPEGETAIITAVGTVRLGAVVKGDGGSITSENSIRVVGTGSDLSSSLANGLTLYAKKDVVFSSLKENGVGSNDWYYKDLNLKGVVYSWGGIEMKLGSDSSLVTKAGALDLEGAIVAYGGDPSGTPGANHNGTIRAHTAGLELRYNPAYFFGLDQTPQPARFHQTLYNPY